MVFQILTHTYKLFFLAFHSREKAKVQVTPKTTRNVTGQPAAGLDNISSSACHPIYLLITFCLVRYRDALYLRPIESWMWKSIPCCLAWGWENLPWEKRKLSSSPLFCCSFFSWTRNGSNDCERLHEVGGRITVVSFQCLASASFIKEVEVRRSPSNAMDLGILSLV